MYINIKINQLKKMTILKYKTWIEYKDIENIDTGMYKFIKVYFLNEQIFEKKHVRWNKKIINLCNNINYITKINTINQKHKKYYID